MAAKTAIGQTPMRTNTTKAPMPTSTGTTLDPAFLPFAIGCTPY